MRHFALCLITAAMFLSACSRDDEPAEKLAEPPPLTAVERVGLLSGLALPYSQADLANGRAVFARCRSCHTITPNGPNMTGPNLYGLMGRPVGTQAGFSYSPALQAADFTWEPNKLDHWLENPRHFLAGNKMSFPGLSDAVDRRDVIAYLAVETAKRPISKPAP